MAEATTLVKEGGHFLLESGGEQVVGHLFDTIPQDAIDQYISLWKPALESASTEDSHWSWMQPEVVNLRGFSLRSQERWQAMMLVREREQMRGRRFGGETGCHIEFFATAPWNRSTLSGLSLCNGIIPVRPSGSCLMLRAIELSQSLGHQGRLSWHSLPGASSTYRRMFPEIESVGIDETGMEWLEVGPTDVLSFRNGMANRLAPGYIALGGNSDANR